MSKATAAGEVLLCFVTIGSDEQAKALAEKLIELRLAACVNAIPRLTSYYRWEGKLECATEVQLLIKTTYARYPQLLEAVRAHHPYSLPEVLAIPLAAGLPEYLNWVLAETSEES